MGQAHKRSNSGIVTKREIDHIFIYETKELLAYVVADCCLIINDRFN
jgi:hypothetical protein